MHYAVTTLRVRVAMHYGEYCLLTQTFGKDNKAMSWKETAEKEIGVTVSTPHETVEGEEDKQ
eukprot:149530-Ditylum_brightwellii.AAC.1